MTVAWMETGSRPRQDQHLLERSVMKDLDAADTMAVINRFNEVTNRHDVDGMMALMTSDVIFESTGPMPNGDHFEGQDAVRECWEGLFRDAPEARFEAEDSFACGDRACVRWIYHWTNADGTAGHIRGIDAFRVRDGKVAEKLAYVKG
jgi:ketosteroid isomerase-like protein